jgi:sortase B
MKQFWKVMNTIYEKTMLGIFIVALLVVIYAMYDTWYVFDQANDKSLLSFKPNRVNAAEIEDSPIASDMVAWITVNDTEIDYPVMQGATNSQYLNLDPYGNYSLSGSIFLDSRNSADFTDQYSIIYGHHMEYGKMFGALDEFLNTDYLKSHSTGELLIGRDGKVVYKLELFYAMTTDAKEEKVFDPEHNDELRQFLKAQGFDRDNRIICLSTCAGGASTTRTAVFAYILED